MFIPEREYFAVPGAGKIRISKEANFSTGGASGFEFGVEWGCAGYAGGVLGRNGAKRLAEFILDELKKPYKDEQEELKEKFKNR